MITTGNNQVPLASSAVEDDEISLLDLGITLAKHKALVIGLPLVAGILAIGISLQMTPIYTASTKILPPQGQSSASAMLAQLGGVAGLGGGLGGRNPNDLYVGMLKSRTVADNLLHRFDLQQYFGVQLPSDARNALGGKTFIASGKDGIITIEVNDKDPKLAAEIANAYVDELFNLTKALAVTEASQRRLFLERQLLQAKENLIKAEIAAKEAMDKGGLASVDIQGRTMIETTARLRGQISAKEVQLGAMRSYAAERNPSLMLAQQELASLKSELAKLEGAAGRQNSAGPFGAGLENLRLVRDVKYYETMYELLAKQFEMAKFDEAKDSAVVQVMDKAIEPDRRSKPKRVQLVVIAMVAATLLGILLAFVREATERTRRDPANAERLQALRQYLSWRKR